METPHVLDMRALYACTRPWTSAIRHLGPLQRSLDDQASGSLSDPRALWIRCYPPHSMGGPLAPISARCLEGLVLLTLLARVDADLWRTAINDIRGEDSWSGNKTRAWVYGELTRLTTGPQAETFTVGIAVTVSKRQHLQLATTQCLSVEDFSADMLRVLTLLNVTVSAEDDPICIPIKYLLDYSNEEEEDLSLALEAIAELKHSECERNATNVRFEVACVRQVWASPDVRALELLLQIRAMGVRLDHLPPLDESCASLDDAVRLTTALRALLLQRPAELAEMRALGIDSVTVSDETSLGLIDAVLSAVECSLLVKTVNLNFEGEHCQAHKDSVAAQQMLWQIAARTLFSGRARHRVKRLSLNVEHFSDALLDAVVTVLQLDNSFSYANPQNREQGPAMRITASRFHMQPIKGAKRRKGTGDVVYESPVPLELNVDRGRFTFNQRDWFSVTLPGRGEAWVEQHDILASTEYTPEYRSVDPSDFDSIRIASMSDSSKSSVASLLGWIGRGTRKLIVTDHLGRSSVDEWIGDVLASCSYIEDVELGHVPLDSLTPFVDCAANQVVRLRRLALPSTAFHPRNMAAFLDALCDPNHALSMHLQEVTLGLRTGAWDVDDNDEEYDDESEDMDDDDSDLEKMLAPVVRMLDTNRTLRKVVLCFQLAGHEEDKQSRKSLSVRWTRTKSRGSKRDRSTTARYWRFSVCAKGAQSWIVQCSQRSSSLPPQARSVSSIWRSVPKTATRSKAATRLGRSKRTFCYQIRILLSLSKPRMTRSEASACPRVYGCVAELLH